MQNSFELRDSQFIDDNLNLVNKLNLGFHETVDTLAQQFRIFCTKWNFFYNVVHKNVFTMWCIKMF